MIVVNSPAIELDQPLSQDQENQELEFTGERFTPECVREIFYEHIHRYVIASHWVSGKRVLDAACGEGYGSNLLASSAASVTGVDISSQAINHARTRYHAQNLSFECADVGQLPFEDNRFDCIVSFETLEHLEAQTEMLHEFRRVLAPEGWLVISTPDKAVYSEKLGNNNEFHVHELYRVEFEQLLMAHFPAVRLIGQKLGFYSVAWNLGVSQAEPEQSAGTFATKQRVALEQSGAKSVDTLRQPSDDPVYLVAVCAQHETHLPEQVADLWLFNDEADSVYRHYHHEIRKNMQAGALLADREAEIDSLKKQLAAAEMAASKSGWWNKFFGK